MPDLNYATLQRVANRAYGCDYQKAMQIATDLPDRDWYSIVKHAFFNPANLAAVETVQLVSSRALLLSGANGSFISTPDVAALDITGSIDLRIELVATDFIHDLLAGPGMITKWGAAGQRSWQWSNNPFSGVSSLVHSNDGTASVGPTGQSTFGFSGAMRTTLDATNGTKTLFTAPSMDGPWTQIDQDAGSATSIFNSTAALVLGTAVSDGTANMFKGRIMRAEVRNGIDGTVVANPDFRNLAPGTTSFTDGAGRVWTLQGNAKII